MLRILIATTLLASTLFVPSAMAACQPELQTVWTPTGQRIDVLREQCAGDFFVDRVRFGVHDNATALHAGGSVWVGEGSGPAPGGGTARMVGAGGDVLAWRTGAGEPRAVALWGFHAYEMADGCALDTLAATQITGPAWRLVWLEGHDRCPALP